LDIDGLEVPEEEVSTLFSITELGQLLFLAAPEEPTSYQIYVEVSVDTFLYFGDNPFVQVGFTKYEANEVIPETAPKIVGEV